jgi:hypothetical protein
MDIAEKLKKAKSKAEAISNRPKPQVYTP